jgi:hypothetical protein
MFYKFDELLARAIFRPSRVTRFAPVAILLALVQGGPGAAQDAERCKAKDGVEFICGVSNVEDMIRIDATHGFPYLFMHEDAREGIASFGEGRQPRFKD